jgi:hypothetical protein
MKKLFAIAILGSVVLVSCKKSSSGSAPLQATISGTVTGFGTDAAGITTSFGGENTITINGFSGSVTSSPNSFTVTIASANPIVAGTYTDTSTVSANAASLQYAPYGGTTFFQSVSGGQASHPTTVVVTSVSSTQIAGTFQGTVYVNGDTTNTTTTPKIITNGTFNVKLTQ